MSLVLDAGAFMAVDRGDRSMIARLQVARRHGIELRTSAIVIAQVWRDPKGRQAELAQLFHAVDVRPIDEQCARESGILIGRARTTDPIDATVVLVASNGDRILTSDSSDLKRLAVIARKRVAVIAC